MGGSFGSSSGSSAGRSNASGVQYGTPLDAKQIIDAASLLQQMQMTTLRDQYGQTAATIAGSPYAKQALLDAERSKQFADSVGQIGTQAATSAYSGANAVESYANMTSRAGYDSAAQMTGLGGQLQQLEGRIGYGPTQLEAALENQAMRDLALGGSLSAQDSREATQAARAAMGARGMAGGSSGVAAELLNRDSYSRSREAERRAFASGVSQTNEAARMARIGMGGQVLGSAASVYGNAGNLLQSALGQASNMQGNATNIRLAGDSANMAAQQNAGNMYFNTSNALSSQNPYSLALGTLPVYGNMVSGATDTAGNILSFNANMLDSRAASQLNNNAAMQGAAMQAGAMRDAGMMGMFGQIGSSIFSDKRMKTDIKPVGKAGNVLGLTAYEFRYKGDKEKHVGFMAQDVKKVLPEAVEEVDHKGKKRLTIKPAVIGAAIAEQLSQAKAA